MKHQNKILLTTIAILSILLLTNPSGNQFNIALPALTKQPNAYFSGNTSVSSFGRKSNFLFFSIYTVNINHGANQVNQTYLGILSNFYLLD